MGATGLERLQKTAGKPHTEDGSAAESDAAEREGLADPMACWLAACPTRLTPSQQRRLLVMLQRFTGERAR